MEKELDEEGRNDDDGPKPGRGPVSMGWLIGPPGGASRTDPKGVGPPYRNPNRTRR